MAAAKKSAKAAASARPVPGPLSEVDERTWAMIAHLTILVNLSTAVLGPILALLIYLILKDRSEYVAFQSLQSFLFQMLGWVAAGALAGLTWLFTGVLSVVLVGLLCIPLACLVTLLPIASVVYGVYAAVECSQGRDFRYWLIGEWAWRARKA